MAADLTSKYLNIARPYALAAFEYAKEKKELADWKKFLKAAAEIAVLPEVIKLLADSKLSSVKIFDLFYDVLQSFANPARKNFLQLLANNKRLLILPQIAELFNTSADALEKRSKVRVVTATQVEESFRQKLAHALTKRINQDVTLHCEVDPKILGGAIIHIGDRVIDGSIRGKLTRLLEFSLR